MSPSSQSKPTFVVTKNGADHQAHVLERRAAEAYVHYLNTDKRLDEWVPASTVRPLSPPASPTPPRKRRRTSVPVPAPASDPPKLPAIAAPLAEEQAAVEVLTEEQFDIQHHRQITARRNFDKVNFGTWQIKTWYFSPYPLTESEVDDGPLPADVTPRIAGVARATVRSHGRTSDLLAGGLGREHASGARSVLWVCDRCFKYMAEGTSWEAHVRRCTRKHPPGRKVYQRGAHIIWEVDGAKEKLYCQNLSLFGKFFIDIKTLFFDCDNFLFYILTDADSQRDHVLGFFSKEKVSYDDYNLACIVIFPPYQRKGYGMLLIEFSYELSRRVGRVGTPERPLSDLGLRSYLTFWVATLARFLRQLLAVLPPERAPGRRRSAKGWDGEHATPAPEADAAAALRVVETTPNADGSATAHVVVRCTLADLARATNLRVEDTAFALNECGLLMKRYGEARAGDQDHRREDEDGESESASARGETVVITREMVEAVWKDRGVKKMCMDMSHVLL